jgi:hypothetical protein
MPRIRLVGVLSACLALVVACEDSTDVQGSTTYGATLSGAKEVPPTTSTATGVFSASLHPTNGTLSYSVTWTGLTGTVTGAHIHGPADASTNANIIINFASPPTGTTNNTMTTTAAGAAAGNLNLNTLVVGTIDGAQLRTMLDAGQLYVNVHTAANPNGEIRGQIAKQ